VTTAPHALGCVTPSATPQVSHLSLHDALPILGATRNNRAGGTRVVIHQEHRGVGRPRRAVSAPGGFRRDPVRLPGGGGDAADRRSEEHTSELQSREHLVCRLLLEKKKLNIQRI